MTAKVTFTLRRAMPVLVEGPQRLQTQATLGQAIGGVERSDLPWSG